MTLDAGQQQSIYPLLTRIVKWSSWVLILSTTACSLHEPYSNSRDHAPVEVRRGEGHGHRGQQYPGQQYPGRAAPNVNRPVYIPQQTMPESNDYSAENAQETVQQRTAAPPAIARLISQAEDALRDEDYRTAAARAEGALRLDPQSVAAYHTLARTYLFEGRYSESEQMALRAISILRGKAPGLGETTSRNLWLLIAETRRSRGDQQGTERAMSQAGGRH